MASDFMEEQDLIQKHDLEGSRKTVANAFALYTKSRSPASAESLSRAKGLPKEGPHPLIARSLPDATLTSLQDQVIITSDLFIRISMLSGIFAVRRVVQLC